MATKNHQARGLTTAEAEMVVRAVKGIPNAMDMDYSGVDPELTSLDIAPEGNGVVREEMRCNHRNRVHK